MKINVELTDKEWEYLSKLMKNCSNKYVMSAEAKFNGRPILEDTVKAHNKNRPLDLDLAKKDAEILRVILLANPTEDEAITKAVLKSLCIEYHPQKIIFGLNDLHIVDFFLPDYNIILEVEDVVYNINERRERNKKLKDLTNLRTVKRQIVIITHEDIVDIRYLTTKILKAIDYVAALKQA